MSAIDNEGSISRARQPLADLRRTLQDVQSVREAERIHAVLIDVIDGLLTHAERQARAIDDIRSDLSHKQGVVTNIGGGEFGKSTILGRLREFASSSNGDRWFLGRDEASGIVHVVHEANPPSGGAVTRIELATFLSRKPITPEVVGLFKLISTLIE